MSGRTMTRFWPGLRCRAGEWNQDRRPWGHGLMGERMKAEGITKCRFCRKIGSTGQGDAAWRGDMISDPLFRTRRCTGPCRRTLPETVEFFYCERRSGTFAACCRACRNDQKMARNQRRHGTDELRGGVGETQRQVTLAFRRIDPGGSEETELRGRLHGIVKRFRGMDVGKKLRAMIWMLGEFLRPNEDSPE